MWEAVSMCMCMVVGAHVAVQCMHSQRPEQEKYLPLCLEIWFLSELEAVHLTKLAGQQTLRICLSQAANTGFTSMSMTVFWFHLDSEYLNSGPHDFRVCAHTHWAISPLPKHVFFVFIFVLHHFHACICFSLHSLNECILPAIPEWVDTFCL